VDYFSTYLGYTPLSHELVTRHRGVAWSSGRGGQRNTRRWARHRGGPRRSWRDIKRGPADWNKPICQHDLDDGLRDLRLAIDTHLITSHQLLPLRIDTPGGPLVEVTDGTAEYNASRYRLSIFYDLAKVAVNRLAFSQGHELKPHGATAVAITPGWLRSEMMLDNFGVTESRWRAALDATRAGSGQPVAPADFRLSESPRYIGPRRRRFGAGPRSGTLEPMLGHF
jgi:NAD(P)-dependent dehydrogenase (short-subunit alcohol dehydrogenase family)